MSTPVQLRVGLWRQLLRHRCDVFMVFAVLLFVALVRVRLLDFPLERDEGEYAYVGQLILQGIPPYKLACNMKFPGTYVAYAVIMLVFGQTPAGIRLGVTCVTTLTGLMLYLFGRALLGKAAGVVAATTYALLAASPSLLGLAGHATHFAALFATAGLCLLWPLTKRLTMPRAIGGGLMFGIAVLMKQHAAFFCLWGLAVVCSACWLHREIALSKRGLLIAAYCAGVLLPFGLTCLILWRAGVFEQFWFWTVGYASQYVTAMPIEWIPKSFVSGVFEAVERGAVMWLVAGAGVLLALADERLGRTRLMLLGFCLASFLTVVPGFYFRRHYFLLTLPAAGLLAGCAVNAASVFARRKSPKTRQLAWIGGVYALAVAGVVYENLDIWLKATPVKAAQTMYWGEPFAEAEIIADYIRTNSAPEAKVAVIGSEPQIYFLSKRHSATGFIYTYALMEPHAYAGQMHQQMISEIESAQPEFVVFASVRTSWLPWPGASTRILHWWADSYQTNYAVVGAALMDPASDTQFLWGQAAADFYQSIKLGAYARPMVLVYRRLTP